MLKKITLTILLLTCALFVPTKAQTDGDAEKQAAIKELLTVMETGLRVSDLMTMIDAQINEATRKIFNQTLAEDKNLSAGDRKFFEDLFFKDVNSIHKSYQKKFLAKIDLDALVIEMTYSIYDKHFTLAEIKDLTTFYQSPTGQKMIKMTPVIMADMMLVITEKMLPKMMEIGKDVEAEMKKEIELKVKEQTLKRKKIKGE
jgi:hypothetical protein